MEKTCPRCNTLKPHTEYHKRTMSSDGLDGTCKVCRREMFNGASGLEESRDDSIREGAEELLTRMGFELYNKDNPVHKQFEERLATKNRIV